MIAKIDVCTQCHRRKVFFVRPYSGQRLCRKCFAESIETKVRATIAKHAMFSYKDRVAVAVSGGKDSLSLLSVLVKLKNLKPKSSLIAVTVDEGISDYRDEALNNAQETCRKLDVEHRIISFKDLFGLTMDDLVKRRVKMENMKLSACSYCGVLRRRALNEVALQTGATKIATAHTLDDEVQTGLMNIFRGDLRRLSKEKPATDQAHQRFVQKVKPFCEIPEKESVLYAYLRNIDFQATPCPYASGALRNDFRNMLIYMEEKHPGTNYSVSSSLTRLRSALEGAIQNNRYGECIKCGEPASSKLCKVCEMLDDLI